MKIGTKSKPKTFKSKEDCTKAANKEVANKKKKGYESKQPETSKPKKEAKLKLTPVTFAKRADESADKGYVFPTDNGNISEIDFRHPFETNDC